MTHVSILTSRLCESVDAYFKILVKTYRTYSLGTHQVGGREFHSLMVRCSHIASSLSGSNLI